MRQLEWASAGHRQHLLYKIRQVVILGMADVDGPPM